MIEAKLIMNLDSQTKISLVLEEDETVVATEDFFQKLEDHTALIAINDSGLLSKCKNDSVFNLWTEYLESSTYLYLSYYQLKSFICMVDSFLSPFCYKESKNCNTTNKLFISRYLSQIIMAQDLFVSIT